MTKNKFNAIPKEILYEILSFIPKLSTALISRESLKRCGPHCEIINKTLHHKAFPCVMESPLYDLHNIIYMCIMRSSTNLLRQISKYVQIYGMVTHLKIPVYRYRKVNSQISKTILTANPNKKYILQESCKLISAADYVEIFGSKSMREFLRVFGIKPNKPLPVFFVEIN